MCRTEKGGGTSWTGAGQKKQKHWWGMQGDLERLFWSLLDRDPRLQDKGPARLHTSNNLDNLEKLIGYGEKIDTHTRMSAGIPALAHRPAQDFKPEGTSAEWKLGNSF